MYTQHTYGFPVWYDGPFVVLEVVTVSDSDNNVIFVGTIVPLIVLIRKFQCSNVCFVITYSCH